MHQLQLIIDDKQHLFKCYMPFVLHGGIFVPTSDLLTLGQTVDVCIDLLGAKHNIVSNVIWQTPDAVVGRSRPAGVGVQIPLDQESLHNEIETVLAGYAPADIERFTF